MDENSKNMSIGNEEINISKKIFGMDITYSKKGCERFVLGILATVLIALEAVVGGCLLFKIIDEWDKMTMWSTLCTVAVLVFVIIISVTIYSFMQLVATWNEY